MDGIAMQIGSGGSDKFLVYGIVRHKALFYFP